MKKIPHHEDLRIAGSNDLVAWQGLSSFLASTVRQLDNDRTMKLYNPIGTALSAICAVGMFLATNSALATFVIASNPGGIDLSLSDAHNVSSDFGTVPGHGTVDITTIGNADFSSGFATITPIRDGSLTTIVFTPVNPNEFGDFSFRGQLKSDAQGIVTLTVQDNQGGPAQTFTFGGLGANADFSRIGITSMDGETIKSITLVSDFKEQKQTKFSLASQVPGVPDTASTLGLLGMALVGIGSVRMRLLKK